MKVNYHTHSHYCGHGDGNLEDYVKAALENNFTDLGFSEHAAFPGDPFGMRMDFNTFPLYIEEAKSLRKEYQNQIRLHIGLEIEYLEAYASYYPMLFSQYDVDYLIMGQHFFMGPDKKCYNLYDNAFPSSYLINHAQNMITGMKTGYFKYIAHPDLMFIRDYGMDENCKKAISTLIEGAEKGNFILELNANGFRRGKQTYSDSVRFPYPVDIFWKEVAKTTIPVMIGADCHTPSNLCDSFTAYAEEYASSLGLHLLTE